MQTLAVLTTQSHSESASSPSAANKKKGGGESGKKRGGGEGKRLTSQTPNHGQNKHHQQPGSEGDTNRRHDIIPISLHYALAARLGT